MVENPTDLEVQNLKDVTEVLKSHVFYQNIANDLGLCINTVLCINTLKFKKHTNKYPLEIHKQSSSTSVTGTPLISGTLT